MVASQWGNNFCTFGIYETCSFIPFIDEGSGQSSYEGGRYLDFKMSNIVDNKLIIDFNKAYNPYCAFTTGYNCPIPPSENTLPVVITAGEKMFARGH
jgi:uncharacterized protein